MDVFEKFSLNYFPSRLKKLFNGKIIPIIGTPRFQNLHFINCKQKHCLQTIYTHGKQNIVLGMQFTNRL